VICAEFPLCNTSLGLCELFEIARITVHILNLSDGIFSNLHEV